MAATCTKCRTKPPNPGRSWCHSCYLESIATPKASPQLCTKCNKNPPNPRQKWCQQCYQPTRVNLCPKCNKNPLPPGSNSCRGCKKPSIAPSNLGSGLNLIPTSSLTPNKRPGIEKQFKDTIGVSVQIIEVLSVFDKDRFKDYDMYKLKMATKNGDANERRWWHGSRLACTLWTNQKLCGGSTCAICGILHKGFLKSHAANGRLGPGLYSAPAAAKSNTYTTAHNGIKCLILCKVVVGKPIKFSSDQPQLRACPSGFDSVLAEGGSFSHVECVVWDEDGVLPAYVIFYK